MWSYCLLDLGTDFLVGNMVFHCGSMGVEQTPNKSQHTKLTLQKKILPTLLPGFKLATFRSRVWCYYKQAILAPFDVQTDPVKALMSTVF